MSKKNSKRHNENLSKVDREKVYSSKEAFSLVTELATAKFDETIDLAIRLGVDPRQADQQVRGSIILPHGTGVERRVLVIAKDQSKIDDAKEAGAEHAGGEELAQKIQDGWLDFDVVVATPDMMGVVGPLGRVLGPQGMMPNPKSGTVTQDIKEAVEDIKAGKVEYRVDKDAVIHTVLGKASFGEKKLRENFFALMDAIMQAKPPTSRGRYLRNVVISSTMGPGVKINPRALPEALTEEDEE